MAAARFADAAASAVAAAVVDAGAAAARQEAELAAEPAVTGKVPALAETEALVVGSTDHHSSAHNPACLIWAGAGISSNPQKRGNRSHAHLVAAKQIRSRHLWWVFQMAWLGLLLLRCVKLRSWRGKPILLGSNRHRHVRQLLRRR